MAIERGVEVEVETAPDKPAKRAKAAVLSGEESLQMWEYAKRIRSVVIEHLDTAPEKYRVRLRDAVRSLLR